jgi:ABC-type lipoprotein release transport system permease subunit
MSNRLLQLAWRNLWRNRRRTLITMAAIALGYVMLLFVACLMAGLRWQMIENGTRLVLSQVQVHAPGYYPNRTIQKTIGGAKGTNVGALMTALTADPRVSAAAPRAYGFGLVSADNRSAGVELFGVDPNEEQKVTVLHTQITRGSYLSGKKPMGVVVGDKLATTIGVAPGSEIVLLTQATDGSMGNDLYTIVGLFHTGLETLDRGVVVMPLAALQKLLQMSPTRIHEVGIKLREITKAPEVAASLQGRLSEVTPVRVMAWPELVPELADYVQFNRAMTIVLFIIFFLVAVIGIMNTMLMAVFERTRELGMLMALGMQPRQVIGLIVAEATALACASLVLGAVIGVPVLWYLQVHGLDLGGKTGEMVSLAGVVVGHLWYGRQDFTAYSQAGVGLALTAVVSALYPAWRAAHLRPTEAIRKV